MTKQSNSVSRRQFMAGSVAMAASAAALSPDPSLRALAAPSFGANNAEQVFASLDKIAPHNVIQNRVQGRAADELIKTPLQQAHAQYSALTGQPSSLAGSAQAYQHEATYRKVVKDVSDRISGIADDGLKYTNYTLETQVEGVWAEQRTATVLWVERVGLTMAGDADPNVPPAFYETRTHLTSLVRDGAAWRIEKDDPDFGRQQAPTFPLDGGPTPTTASQAVKQHSSIVRPKSQLVIPSDAVNIMGSYNPSNAKSYAESYKLSSREANAYHDFGQNYTNFVSQCMKHGGWQHVDGNRTSNASWWYSGWWPYYASHTWANAENFYWFIRDSGRGSHLNSVWSLMTGDVIQYDFEKDNNINHTQICHYRSSTGVIYMAQHSTEGSSNYVWKPLSDILAGKDWWCYAWRMTGLKQGRTGYNGIW